MQFRITALILSLFAAVILLTGNIYASDTQISESADVSKVDYQKVNPDNTFSYSIKRLQEKIMLLILSLSSDAKANYYAGLTNKRLAELEYIIEKKDMGNFEVATKRYYTTLGDFYNFISKDKDTKSLFDKRTSSHRQVLERLRDFYDGTTAEWRFIQDDINYLSIYSEKLK